MEYNAEKREIVIKKELNNLDEFAVDFVSLLDENYVIISGYVCILLGRSRATEDIDMLVPKMNKQKFCVLWKKIHSAGFECVNTSNIDDAFDIFNEASVRFYKKTPVPNIEFKPIKDDLDRHSFENRIKIIVAGKVILISPLEIQIAYKLYLGSEKDIEDAKHIYNIFKEKLNKDKLQLLLNKLRVNKKMRLLE